MANYPLKKYARLPKLDHLDSEDVFVALFTVTTLLFNSIRRSCASLFWTLKDPLATGANAHGF